MESTCSNQEKTVVLLKPDAHEYRVIEEIIDIIRNHEMHIEKRYRFARGSIPGNLLEDHYGNLPQNHRDNAVASMLSGEITALLCSGVNVVGRMRALGGTSFDPAKCEEGTIRKIFSRDTIESSIKEERSVRNIIHTSDSVESALREKEIWFDGKYQLNYIDESPGE
jgi:nucleoside-diphosphate kinase